LFREPEESKTKGCCQGNAKILARVLRFGSIDAKIAMREVKSRGGILMWLDERFIFATPAGSERSSERAPTVFSLKICQHI
jgi:hypothetical protein